jgi:uncharacterized protein (TIGR03086 family)
MSEIADRYRRLSADLARTVEGVPDDRWSSPTPCADWDARRLVQHLVDSQGQFLGLVGLAVRPGPPVDDDPVGAWTAARDQLQAALDDPTTATAEFDGFDGRSTLERAVERFICLDLVVHRWDLARATGQDERLDPDDVAWAHRAAAAFGPMLRMEGVCGPEVEVPEDADAQTRMLAFGGRRV